MNPRTANRVTMARQDMLTFSRERNALWMRGDAMRSALWAAVGDRTITTTERDALLRLIDRAREVERDQERDLYSTLLGKLSFALGVCLTCNTDDRRCVCRRRRAEASP